MRSAIKRIFRRKTDKKKQGRGSREPTDDSTPDEVGDTKPVSLFQPKPQGRIENPPPPSSVGSGYTTSRSLKAGKPSEQNTSKSTSSSSIIAPIRQEFDQGSAPPSLESSTEETKVSQQSSSDKMKTSIGERNEEIPDAPTIANNYAAIPVLEQTKLPRGGVSVETQAVGRVQVRSTFCQSILFVLVLVLICML